MPADRPDAASAQELTAGVARLRRALRRTADEVSTRPSAQVEMLELIERHGPVRVGALAGAMGLAPSTASELLARLVADRLVVRQIDRDDRRAAAVRLSAPGRRELTRARSAYADSLKAAIDQLPLKHQRALAAGVPALAALADALGES